MAVTQIAIGLNTVVIMFEKSVRTLILIFTLTLTLYCIETLPLKCPI